MFRLNVRLVLCGFAALILAPQRSAHADPLGTAFTYQGSLKNSGSPANGSFNMVFKLWNDPALTAPANQIGSTITINGVSVASGLFTVPLDFGAAYNGDKRGWLEITVSGTTLSPRQELTPSPYALRASQNWALGGNTGTNAATHFLGTIDDEPLEFRVDNQRALRLEKVSATFGFDRILHTGTNVAGGSSINVISAGVPGATIAGGGLILGSSDARPNVVTDLGGTVGGGAANLAGDNAPTNAHYCTVGGGSFNRATGYSSTVGGGDSNFATGQSSTIGGGSQNEASGFGSTVGGGLSNDASGQFGTVPGGNVNLAGGLCSFAAGRGARVRDSAASGDADGDEGTFVWADSNSTPFFTSTGPDQFLIRAAGGVGIGTNNPTQALDVVGQVKTRGAFGQAGAGALTYVNDTGYIFIGPESGSTADGAAISLAGPLDTLSGVPGGIRFNTPGASPAMVITSGSGRIGLGTTSPARMLHLRGQQGFMRIDRRDDGGGTALLMHQYHDNAGVDEAWKTFGLFVESTGVNDGRLNIADLGTAVSGGGTSRMVIDNSGNVGIGTTTPSAKLHVVGNICATGTIGACSDARFKDHIEPVADALDMVEQLQGVTFDWKREEFCDHQFAAGRQLGFIAQEVEKVLPQVVSTGSDGYKSVDYGRLTPVIVEAVKQIQNEVEEKDAKIADLTARLAHLEAVVNKLTEQNSAPVNPVATQAR